MKFLVSLIILFGGSFSANAKITQGCLSFEPAPVILKGKITRKTFAGPPNYEKVTKGDTPETYWILHLIRPICVNADGNIPGRESRIKNVSNLQLILSKEQYAQYKGLRGKRIEVSGKLMLANTGHHHTNVLLTVAGIKVVRKK